MVCEPVQEDKFAQEGEKAARNAMRESIQIVYEIKYRRADLVQPTDRWTLFVCPAIDILIKTDVFLAHHLDIETIMTKYVPCQYY